MSDDWRTSPNAAPYLPALYAAEIQYCIPHGLLARVAYQESHFRDDIVDGTVKSPAGAVGLMQMIPRFFPGVGKDWRDDIMTAAKELARLYHAFNDWQLAIAGYNWGQGNVVKWQAGTIDDMPFETKNYVAQVFADVPQPGSILTENA